MHRSALEITKHPAHDLIDPEWVGWSGDQLLDLPMGRLNLEIKGSFLEGPIAELDDKFRREVRRKVASWTGEYQYTIDQVLEDMIQRCRQLDLRVSVAEEQAKLDFTILLTVHTMNYLRSGRHRVAL